MAKLYQYQQLTEPVSPISVNVVTMFSVAAVNLVFPHVVQYQAKAEPLRPLTVAETVTVDKWQTETNKPIFDVKRQQHLYPPFSIEPFQLTLGETVKVFGNELVVISTVRSTQYQAKVDPLVPIVSEIKTVDKWYKETARPVWKVPNQSWITGDYAFNLDAAQRNERTTPDKWQPQTNQPLFDAKRQQFTYQNFGVDPTQLTQRERTTPDKWQPETNKPLFDVKRQQYTYPVVFFHPEPQEVTQFESPGEFARNIDRIFDIPRNQYLYPSLVTDANLLTQKERVSFDKWNYQQSLPRWDAPRNQYLYPAYAANIYPISQTADLTEAGIRQTNVPYFPIKHAEHLYPSFTVDQNALTQKERITVDKWVPETNKPRFDIARNQFSYPSLTFNPQPFPSPIFVERWYQRASEPVWQVKNQNWITTGDLELTATQRIERVSLDRWQQPQSLPFAIKGLQHLNPSTFWNPRVPGEIITLDKWLQSPILVSGKTGTQYLYPTLFYSHQQLVPQFGWYVQTGEPIRLKQRLLAQEPTLISVVQAAEGPVTLDKWFRPTEQPFFIPKQHRYIESFFTALRRMRTRYVDKFSPRGTVTTDKFSQRGTSFNDKFSNRGSSYEDKFSNQGSIYDDTYSNRATTYNDKIEPL